MTKQLRKQTNKQTNKADTLPAQPIFPNDFSQVVYLFLSQKFLKQA